MEYEKKITVKQNPLKNYLCIMNENISHEGVVIKSEKGLVCVRIMVASACDSCRVKSMCGIADLKEKIIEVKDEESYEIGQAVEVIMLRRQGMKAVFYGYFLPFLILLFSLIGGVHYFSEEGAAAGLSLLLVAFYYLILFFFRKELQKKFSYKIRKI
jgi:positive regulator of sigma E activity